jgi:hypothetical protein
MHYMASTCPHVGSKCYPSCLGVTKDIMSRGLQIEDMECREPADQLSLN